MARTIDDVIEYARTLPGVSAVQAEIMAMRLEHKPDAAEIALAKGRIAEREKENQQ